MWRGVTGAFSELRTGPFSERMKGVYADKTATGQTFGYLVCYLRHLGMQMCQSVHQGLRVKGGSYLVLLPVVMLVDPPDVSQYCRFQ